MTCQKCHYCRSCRSSTKIEKNTVDSSNVKNMKLTLFYCDLQMGVLEKTEKGYVYNSNIENEERMIDLIESKLLPDSVYSLWYSYNRVSKELFIEFQRIVSKAKRRDIVERAEITSNDTLWEKLVKLSELRYYPTGFYVQSEENISKQI